MIETKVGIELLELVKSEFPYLAVTSSISSNIEINSIHANKGNALDALCNEIGVKSSGVLAFGDGLNDLYLFETAGTCVAMANGIESLKENADYITNTNENDGVAEFLQKYILRSMKF